jgi:hypothetical protein
MDMGAIALNYRKLFTHSLIRAVFFALIFGSTQAKADAGDIVVVAPGASNHLASPFNVYARSATCSGQQVTGMGYSLDTSLNTQMVNASTINTMAIAGTGSHTLHLKSWGIGGSACTQDVAIIVYQGSLLPPTVTVASNIQRLDTWQGGNDAATNGSTTGTTTLTVNGPSLSRQSRQFTMTFQNDGGEIFHVSFDNDPVATHFIYDAQIRLTSTVGIGNIEMDMNQVIANGQTVIYGVQCDGFYNTWDYTINSGTPAAPVDTWVHSTLPCNPQNWTPDTWHHVEIAYSRDALGNVTYESVSLDGIESDFVGATGNSAFALGWNSTLLTNLQFDGVGGAGQITAYLDNLAIYRW